LQKMTMMIILEFFIDEFYFTYPYLYICIARLMRILYTGRDLMTVIHIADSAIAFIMLPRRSIFKSMNRINTIMT